MAEETVLSELLLKVQPKNRFFVDIGASDGVVMSNSLALCQQGWAGFAVEYDPEKFAILSRVWRGYPVHLMRSRVVPDNILAMLAAAEVPQEFAFLTLDIDSWDGPVLQQLLTAYRPAIICAEINETIPPPVKFSVCPSDAPLWNGGNFFGQSLSFLYDVAQSAKYSLVSLHYNNAFLVPNEAGLLSLSPEVAYAQGFRDRPDRDVRFPYDAWMSELWELTPQELLASVQKRFAEQTTPYTLSL